MQSYKNKSRNPQERVKMAKEVMNNLEKFTKNGFIVSIQR